MAIIVDAELRRLNQQEFGAVAYEVMECVFQVHRELGRFFDEDVYRDAIACRLPAARKEVRISVRFDGYCKVYSMDLLVGGGAVFELKTAEKFSSRHQAQLINYLLLAELSHGKLVVRVSALDSKSLAGHEEQLRRFVNHTQVAALQWINIGTSQLTFKTIQSNR